MIEFECAKYGNKINIRAESISWYKVVVGCHSLADEVTLYLNDGSSHRIINNQKYVRDAIAKHKCNLQKSLKAASMNISQLVSEVEALKRTFRIINVQDIEGTISKIERDGNPKSESIIHLYRAILKELRKCKI